MNSLDNLNLLNFLPYTGESKITIDEKARFGLPASIYTILGKRFQAVSMLDEKLWIVYFSPIEKEIRFYDGPTLSSLSGESSINFGDFSPTEILSSHRVNIGTEIGKEYGLLSQEVKLIGCGDYFKLTK